MRTFVCMIGTIMNCAVCVRFYLSASCDIIRQSKQVVGFKDLRNGPEIRTYSTD